MSKSHLDVAHKERPGDSRPASNPIPCPVSRFLALLFEGGLNG